MSIADSAAGANATDAGASYDDNETTSWVNDNRLVTAWIEFELAREASLSEAALKLKGWWQRSYPIRITVEGQEVFRGRTPTSLGYVTLPLKPIAGRRVKLELVNASQVREGFDFNELQNQANASAGDERQGSGTLNLVEIEFYEGDGNAK